MCCRSTSISGDEMAEFVKVARFSDIGEGKLKYADANGEEVCLIKSGGKVYALQEYCTHEEGPMHEGRVQGDEVVCPWHDARFDIRTGKVNPETDWTDRDLKTFEVKVEGDDVFVKV